MMDRDVRNVVLEELSNIAPEADLQALDPAANLHDALDIDSMDFLNFIAALHHRLDVNVPELDYQKLMTLQGAISYLKAKLPPG
jgi:acyl carrier protein